MRLTFEPFVERPLSSAIYRATFHAQALTMRAGAYALSRLARRLVGSAAPAVVRVGGTFVSEHGGRLVLGGSLYTEEGVQVKAYGLIRLGHGVRLRQGVVLTMNGAATLTVGDRTNVGEYAVIMARGPLCIGSDVMIDPGCVIAAETHGKSLGDLPYADQPMRSVGISIGDNVWLSSQVTVLDGVTIGATAIVAAGSTVMKSIPPSVLAAGIRLASFAVSTRSPPRRRSPRAKPRVFLISGH